MAQTIVTTCDAHEETDEHRGTPVLVSLDGVNVLVVDLCDDARAELVEPLRALVAEYGRPVPPDELAAMRRRSPGGGKTKPAVKVQCPRCEHPPLRRSDLGKHVRAEHGTTLPLIEAKELGRTVEGHELTVWCDACGGGFTSPVGLAAHVRSGTACPGRQQAKNRARKSAAKRAAKSA